MSGPAQTHIQEFYCLFETAFGVCGMAWTDQGLTRLQLPEADRDTTERRTRSASNRRWDGDLPTLPGHAVAEIQRYATGQRVDFMSVALDLRQAPPFHRRVFVAARRLGWGQTISYGGLARRAGAPGAARAVGQALARNPIAIIIPCHRVLASGEKIGGFSAFGGAFAKRRLLALEGVRTGSPPDLFATASER